MTEIDVLKTDVRISPENIITKSNLLIDSNYRLSPLESKLIATLFSNVQPNDEKFNTYVFPIKEFTDFLELKGKSKYEDLRNITLNLMEAFEIKIGDEITQVSWLSYVQYNEKKGSITLRFDRFWEPYILQLRKNFTSYKLGNITKLKSSYSIRLYELLKQRQSLRKRTFFIQELRDKLGIESNIYPRYANFKQRVLLTAQREMREESDIFFDFIEIKNGRSVEKIEFIIYHNPDIIPQESPQFELPKELNNLNQELISVGITREESENILKLFSKERIKQNITYTANRVQKGAVKRHAAYLKRAIEQDYANTKIFKPIREEVIPEWWDKKQQSDSRLIEPLLPIDKERVLIEKLTLMREFNKSEVSIYEDLALMMKDYQNEHFMLYGRLIDPNKFTHPYIQELCKNVLESI